MIYSILQFTIRLIQLLDFLLVSCVVYFLAWLPNLLLGRWYKKLFKWWCWLFIRALGVNLKLHQKNAHPLPSHAIYIGNHPSAFEDIGMPALFPARYIAKQEVRDWWFVGKISNAVGTLYFDRENSHSRKKIAAEIKQRLSEGDSIGIYPEGGCKGRHINLPFRIGLFDIAIQSKVPLVPVFLHYESQEDFEWQGQTLPWKLIEIMRSSNKTAHYYVFDAIDPNKFESKELLCHHVQTLYLEWQKKYLE